MDLDQNLIRYFATTDLTTIPASTLEAGIEHMLVDFGLEQDGGRRFALWVLLYMLGAAPDLDVAFETEAEREAARNFMDLSAMSDEE